MKSNESKSNRAGRRPRLSFANVTALVALFVALGGSAYAVSKAPRDSVYSSSIVNEQVKNKDLKPETIRSNRIKQGQVRASDLGAITERTQTIPVVNGSQNNTTVECEAEEVVIGGGAAWDSLNTGARLQQSHRDGNGWNAGGQNDSGAQRQLTVKAYCLEG